jgi:hypothetical protein
MRYKFDVKASQMELDEYWKTLENARYANTAALVIWDASGLIELNEDKTHARPCIEMFPNERRVFRLPLGAAAILEAMQKQ